MNIFKDIVKGLEWVGTGIEKVVVGADKIITVVPELEADAHTLLPEAIAIIDAAGNLALASVKDGGTVVFDFQVILADAKNGNISAALNATANLFSDATSVATFADVLSSFSNLVVAVDTFGTDGAAALKKLEQDA